MGATLGQMVGRQIFFGEKSPVRTYARLSAAKVCLEYLLSTPLGLSVDLSLAKGHAPDRKKNKGAKHNQWNNRPGHGKGGGKGKDGDMSGMMNMMNSMGVDTSQMNMGKGKGKGK